MDINRKNNFAVSKACITTTNKYKDAMKAIWKGVPPSNFDVDNLIQEMAESKKRLDEIMSIHKRFSI